MCSNTVRVIRCALVSGDVCGVTYMASRLMYVQSLNGQVEHELDIREFVHT